MKHVIYKNYRNKDGEYPTYIKCGYCGKSSESYVEIKSNDDALYIRLCKGCLSKFIDDINNDMINDCKNN